MAILSPHVEHETRRAWSEYADRVRGLEGEEYARVEQEAWEHLQSTLDSLGAADSTTDDPTVG